jgi:hypothetical protein
MLADARKAASPRVVDASKVRVGGVDPLGLRQINFGLMDEVLPDLNNVASHVRPYILMAWAWRRVRRLVEEKPKPKITDEQMRDFVDRIEAIYAWSQFMVWERPDIPGRVAMAPLLEAESYRFGGKEWEARRNMRRESTGLISPLNYGPSLRTMGWLNPVAGKVGVFQPRLELDAALDAFERAFAGELSHNAFNKFGPVTVKRDDAERWGELWDVGKPLRKEREAAFDRLAGRGADERRQRGIALIQAAYRDLDDDKASNENIRARMADIATLWGGQEPRAAADWRALQVRQAFRLAMEALFYWTILELRGRPLRSVALAKRFLNRIDQTLPLTAREWFSTGNPLENPVSHVDALQEALRTPPALPDAIIAAIRHSLLEAPEKLHAFERRDRMPLKRAKEEAESWFDLSPHSFMIKVFDVWIMAQHTYWCVTRGLADARSAGKTILRMRIVMDESGWTLTPQTTHSNLPQVTPDRLDAAISLLSECRRLDPRTNG